jgi:molecular chaperone GrpE (heat shock protein)
MNAPETGPVLRKLDELQDLFQRRLLEDRTTRQVLAELTERTQRAEAGLFREYLHPLVCDLARLVDRLDRQGLHDYAQELIDALAAYGIREVPAEGGFDPAWHEAVEAVERPGLPDRAVVALRRRGFAHGDWVFRPAQVVVNRVRE